MTVYRNPEALSIHKKNDKPYQKGYRLTVSLHYIMPGIPPCGIGIGDSSFGS
ncbi:MAG: hypothetical protein ACTICO_05730 [Leuconostoc citreum]